MAYERSTTRYRYWYARLLRLYPKRYRERFGEGMEQTFNDLCRERRAAGGRLFSFVLWMCFETFVGIIKENITFVIMHNMTKSIWRAAIGTGLILLIPLALQLTIGTGVNGQGFNWTPGDFAAIGILLFGAGLAIDFAVRTLANPRYRIAAVTIIVLAFLTLWAELAVDAVSQAMELLF